MSLESHIRVVYSTLQNLHHNYSCSSIILRKTLGVKVGKEEPYPLNRLLLYKFLLCIKVPGPERCKFDAFVLLFKLSTNVQFPSTMPGGERHFHSTLN